MPVRSILSWLAIGLVVGLLGKFVLPGKDASDVTGTILAGIAGALIAGFVAETMHWEMSGTWQNYVVSIAGAAVAVAVYRMARNHRPG